MKRRQFVTTVIVGATILLSGCSDRATESTDDDGTAESEPTPGRDPSEDVRGKLSEVYGSIDDVSVTEDGEVVATVSNLEEFDVEEILDDVDEARSLLDTFEEGIDQLAIDQLRSIADIGEAIAEQYYHLRQTLVARAISEQRFGEGETQESVVAIRDARESLSAVAERGERITEELDNVEDLDIAAEINGFEVESIESEQQTLVSWGYEIDPVFEGFDHAMTAYYASEQANRALREENPDEAIEQWGRAEDRMQLAHDAFDTALERDVSTFRSRIETFHCRAEQHTEAFGLLALAIEKHESGDEAASEEQFEEGMALLDQAERRCT